MLKVLRLIQMISMRYIEPQKIKYIIDGIKKIHGKIKQEFIYMSLANVKKLTR